MTKNTKYNIDDKFSHLTIKQIIPGSKYVPVQVLCQCDCGNSILVKRAANYVSSYKGIQSCGCQAMKGRTGPQAKAFKGVGDIGNHYYLRLQHGAKNRNIPFNVTLEFIWELFLKQNRKCIFTEEPLVFYSPRQNEKGLETTASLDRISNNKGYEINNVQWVHKHINYIRGNQTIEQLIQMCRRVNNYKNFNILPLQPNEEEITKITKLKQIVPGWKGIGEIGLNALSNCKRHAKNKWPFEISLEYLWKFFQQQNKLCPFTGERLIFGSQGSKIETTASLDRINSKIGYIKGNVRWIHKDINWAKHDIPDKRFIELCTKISTINAKKSL